MSDSPDLPEIEVHPAPAEDPPPTQPSAEQHPPHESAGHVDGGEGDENVLPDGLDLNLAAALSAIPPEDDEMVDHEHGQLQALDPDTLADLAALSRMEDEEEGGGELVVDEGQDFAELIGQAITNEQVQEFVDTFGHVQEEEQHESSAPTPSAPPSQPSQQIPPASRRVVHDFRSDRAHSTDESDNERRDPDSLYYTENGKVKRRRNRTVLSCTECHRRCDRNIPCGRCIKRGVPSMCQMEAPPGTQRKRPRPNEDVPVNYELGRRVQALESLIRSARETDPDATSSVAMETVMQATRAANNGHPEAVNALAQLTDVSNNMAQLTPEAQSSLLMDVLHQLSNASLGRSGEASYSDLRDTWSAIPLAQAQSTVQIEEAHEADDAPNKLNVAVHGFRDDKGNLYRPPTVKHAEKKLREDPDLFNVTLPIEGYAPFLDLGTRLGYGEDSVAYKNKRIAAIQTMSVTGGLRMAAIFLSRFPATASMRSVLVQTPAAEEDIAALRDGGLDVKMIRFLDHKTGLVDWDGFREDLQSAPPRSAVLLHISGGLPTGADLTAQQWRQLTTLLLEKHLIPLAVMAYQGLSSGDTNRDAQPLRYMVHEGLPVVLVQGFDSTMGLYADSPAIMSVATQNTNDRDRVDSQLRNIARALYYHPPAWGARLAHIVLSDVRVNKVWLSEVHALAMRLKSVREKLYELLANKFKTPGNWEHIKRASGMYITLLLPQAQLEALTAKRHIHLLPESCVNLGCLNAAKLESLARAVDAVVRDAAREAEEQAQAARQMELALKVAREREEQAEAEAALEAAAAAAAAAEAESRMFMEQSIQQAMEAQRAHEEEEEAQRTDQASLLEEVRKAAQREEIARQAEMIVGQIHGY
ncbi:PLP-dependent transferase [Cutaneotrichosporon oleaginosum]|uniref:PLP-dependent transferase n=1 Tax=Cutaneotrichosporon oleaginosum TaxID=879819 RepID=A0A0J0XFY9_9TREE|nr:PLP-dependent transferase [Cutaneotrichosporon oleaginosum]KLT39975.1 PLP-dependent transferase [Cutaneotrichosporon oleaginosum]TXT14164.1 hypothetical protein COLE_00357 [Cutaneotrichosporon oleaginosum]